jgi:putative nucleotidyltransferase with HDIG domain
MDVNTYIPVKKSLLPFYTPYCLYCKRGEENYSLYKGAGVSIQKIRLDKEHHPVLFLHDRDRLAALKGLQERLSNQIEDSISAGDVGAVKSIMVEYVEEALSNPRSGSLKLLPETTEMLVSKFSKTPSILKAMASMASTDYTTISHSVNVMALTMGFCLYHGYSKQEANVFSLAGLLHDLGKIEIPREILTAPRKLTEEEFGVMESHTIVGADIVRKIRGLDRRIAHVALQHHEKVNGSGYPYGIRDIPFISQLIGFIDAYEALTTDERPYRRSEKPFKTLLQLKNEMEAGRFTKEVFVKFCLSLE